MSVRQSCAQPQFTSLYFHLFYIVSSSMEVENGEEQIFTK